MAENPKAGKWQHWHDVKLNPKKLLDELDAAFKDAEPNTYPALEVRVENPIHEYRILSP